MIEVLICAGVVVALMIVTIGYLYWVVCNIGDSKDDEE